jgi:hypothetical protein
MRRRTLLVSGLAGTAVLAATGWGVHAWPRLAAPAWVEQSLSPSANRMMAVWAEAVLGNLLPDNPAERAQALSQHLKHLQTAIQGLPRPVQSELDLVMRLLLVAPGRLALTGLSSDWPQAAPQQLADALQAMRHSRLMLRKQVYQALRDLHLAAWTADASNWARMNYPGPVTI